MRNLVTRVLQVGLWALIAVVLSTLAARAAPALKSSPEQVQQHPMSGKSPADKDATPCPTEDDIEPKGAITARFTGRDAHLFIEAVEPGIKDTTWFDTVLILSGSNVFGGIVAIPVRDKCLVGRKFLSGLDYIHGTQMLKLYRTNPALQHRDHLEEATLKAMAEGGDPVAQFHFGYLYAMGYAVDMGNSISRISPDRRASIAWLKRAAQQGFSPAMLTLGIVLTGPGWNDAQIVGEPPRKDEFTDLVTAYSWFDAASRSSEPDVKGAALSWLRGLTARMTPEELQKAKELAQKQR
jgi:hypothetical protein